MYIQPAWADDVENIGTTSVLENSAIHTTYSKSADGSPDGSWEEGILAVNGKQAFCTQISSHFKAHMSVIQIDPKQEYGWSQDDIDALALGVDYILSGKFEYEKGKFLTNSKQTYAVAQKWVWEYLRDMGLRGDIKTQEAQYSWIAVKDNSTGENLAPPGSIMQVYDYVNKNKTRYSGTVIYWYAGENQNLAQFSIVENKGSLELKKASTTQSVLSASSLEGGRYGVFPSETDAQANQNIIHELTTNKDGKSNTIELENGIYFIKELEAPRGYEIDKDIHEVRITGGKHQILNVEDTPQAELLLKKTSSAPDITERNSQYSLEGARYSVKDSAGVEVGVLETDASGTSHPLILDSGTYVISEIQAPRGFLKSNEEKSVTLKPGEQSIVSFKEEPITASLDVIVQKIDSETQQKAPQSPASFEGAEFLIEYLGATASYNQDKPLRSWTIKTDGNGTGKISNLTNGDEPYLHNNAIVAPLGTYLVQEISAPRGYILPPTDPILIEVCKSQENAESLVFPITEIYEDIIRGDFEFTKVDASTMRRLANIPFAITNTETGESHIVVSDENGFVSTATSHNKHSYKTNANDETKGNAFDSSAGIWFGENDPHDDRGALTFGTYLVQEIPCSTNEGYDMVEFEVHISKDSTTLDLGTVDNKIHVDQKVTLQTTATTKDGGKYADPLEKVHLIDEVSFEGLTVGKTYRITGEFLCADDTTKSDYEAQ
ncbi:MAG: VaFE repeat-containing surface-anchored protein, partial [Eggerthellaceae bacterium]|nr:VaFE repeat-containing surface-anchored protein [Eggerthellaceae bacterium]